MNRTLMMLAGWVLVSGVVGGAEETVASTAPVNEAAKATEKALAEAPAKAWPVAPKPGPLLAKVVFTTDRTLEKCWVKVFDHGAWVIVDDAYCWFLRSAFKEITYLNEEPSEALKKSMETAEAKRKANLESQRKADEARAKAEAEKKKEQPAPEAGKTAAGAGTAGSTTTSSRSGAASSASASRKTNTGGGTGLPAFDRRSVTASKRSGSGGGSVPSAGPRHVYGKHYYRTHLHFQWRVLRIDRENGEVKLRNRGSKDEIDLVADDPVSLEGVKRGDLLVGTLDVTNPQLATKKDGKTVSFKPPATMPE